MAHRFTCGEKKIWQNIEKSQNIMKLIVAMYQEIGVVQPHYCIFDIGIQGYFE